MPYRSKSTNLPPELKRKRIRILIPTLMITIYLIQVTIITLWFILNSKLIFSNNVDNEDITSVTLILIITYMAIQFYFVFHEKNCYDLLIVLIISILLSMITTFATPHDDANNNVWLVLGAQIFCIQGYSILGYLYYNYFCSWWLTSQIGFEMTAKSTFFWNKTIKGY